MRHKTVDVGGLFRAAQVALVRVPLVPAGLTVSEAPEVDELLGRRLAPGGDGDAVLCDLPVGQAAALQVQGDTALEEAVASGVGAARASSGQRLFEAAVERLLAALTLGGVERRRHHREQVAAEGQRVGRRLGGERIGASALTGDDAKEEQQSAAHAWGITPQRPGKF
jgi:hypothetical protein